jgi:cytochrome-b5 reductase
MYQMIKRVLDDDQDTRSKLWLIYANKGERDILLKQELDELEEQHKDRLKIMYVLEQPPSDWKQETGRVTANMVKTMLHDNSTGENGNKDRRLVLVCGPDGMLNSISGQRARDYTQGSLTGILAQLGLTAEEVWKFQ